MVLKHHFYWILIEILILSTLSLIKLIIFNKNDDQFDKNDDQFNRNDVIIIDMRRDFYNITLEQALGIEIFNPVSCRHSWFWKQTLSPPLVRIIVFWKSTFEDFAFTKGLTDIQLKPALRLMPESWWGRWFFFCFKWLCSKCLWKPSL